jgi:YD repeat-containing protein
VQPAAHCRLITTSGYDALGRLTQVTQTVSEVGYLTTYGYDGLGNCQR